MSDLWHYLTGELLDAPPPRDPDPEPEAPAPAPPAVLDLAGVGIGTANLAVAALADGVAGLAVRLFDAQPSFGAEPDEDQSAPVSFLADLVTMVEPASRWSYLSYLRAHQRMHPFYLDGRFHLARREYDEYCAWVAGALDSCRFGTRVDSIGWDGEHFVIRTARTAQAIRHDAAVEGDGVRATVLARHLVLDLNLDAPRPKPLSRLGGLVEWPATGDEHRLRTHPDVTGAIFVQRTDAAGDAYRGAALLNLVAGGELFTLVPRSAVTPLP